MKYNKKINTLVGGALIGAFVLCGIAAAFPDKAHAQLNVVQGGTGTSSVPANYVLIGKDALHLTAVATSSLGLTGTTYTATYPITLSGGNAFGIAFGTTTANVWALLQTFTSGLISQASSTISALHLGTPLEVASGGTASTTLGGILTGNGTGAITSATVSSPLTFSANTLACATCNAYGWPFTPATNFGASVQSTSTPIWDTAGLQASSTSQFVNLNIWSLLTLKATTSALLGTDAAGNVISTTTPTALVFNATQSGATSTFAGNVHVVQNLQVDGNFFAPVQLVTSGNATINGTLAAGTTTVTNLIVTNTSTSTFAGGISFTNFNATGSGTSTAANGFNIAAGCYAIAGTCLVTGAGSGVVLSSVYATSTPGSNVLVQLTGAAGSAASFSSGTLTLPSDAVYFTVEMWGAGGGGAAGASATQDAATTGGNSCFSSSATACNAAGTIATSTGGTFASAAGAHFFGGTGGTATGGDVNISGGAGGGPFTVVVGGAAVYESGALGGVSPLGGGPGLSEFDATGGVGASPGGGGTGGGVNAGGSGQWAGGGGGAGAYFLKRVMSPSGTYRYTIGAGGIADGSQTGGGSAGGNGAAGGFKISVYTPTGISQGSVGSGTTGQMPYYSNNGTALAATSSIFLSSAGFIGIGSTTPGTLLSVGTPGVNFTTATTTWNTTGGINIKSGCVAKNGNCIPVMTQAVVTGSRAFATVYQNTTGYPLTISIAAHDFSFATLQLLCYSDPSATPTVIVAASQAGALGNNVDCTFMVPNGYYYQATNNGIAAAVDVWTEWTIGQ